MTTDGPPDGAAKQQHPSNSARRMQESPKIKPTPGLSGLYDLAMAVEEKKKKRSLPQEKPPTTSDAKPAFEDVGGAKSDQRSEAVGVAHPSLGFPSKGTSSSGGRRPYMPNQQLADSLSSRYVPGIHMPGSLPFDSPITPSQRPSVPVSGSYGIGTSSATMNAKPQRSGVLPNTSASHEAVASSPNPPPRRKSAITATRKTARDIAELDIGKDEDDNRVTKRARRSGPIRDDEYVPIGRVTAEPRITLYARTSSKDALFVRAFKEEIPADVSDQWRATIIGNPRVSIDKVTLDAKLLNSYAGDVGAITTKKKKEIILQELDSRGLRAPNGDPGKEVKADSEAETEEHREISTRITDPSHSLHVGWSIYDEKVSVHASLNAAGIVTFKVAEVEARASTHDFCSRYKALYPQIKFKEAWENDTEAKKSIKTRLKGMRKEAEAKGPQNPNNTFMNSEVPPRIIPGEPKTEPTPVIQEKDQPLQHIPIAATPHGVLTALDTLRRTILDYGAELAGRDNTIAGHKDRMQRLEDRIKDRDAELKRQKDSLKEQEDSIKEHEKKSAEKDNTICQLQAQIATSFSLKQENASQAPEFKSPGIRDLQLLGKTFNETFLKLAGDDPNAGKYVDRRPILIMTAGKCYMRTRILQEVNLQVAGDLEDGEVEVRGVTFSRYMHDGQLKLMQKFGPNCLVKSLGREFVCWLELIEMPEEKDEGVESLL